MLTEGGVGRRVAEDIYERLRREAAALAKTRHPSILKIIEPLEESKSSMEFVTEPVNNSLRTLVSMSQAQRGDSEDMNELAIQKGLLQIIEGLLFLHKQAGLVHLDVTPTSILVDSKGDWKLAGLGFLHEFQSAQDYFLPQYDPRVPDFVHINLDFAAPEVVIDHKLDPASDVFSLGCLILATYTGQPPMSNRGNPNSYKSEFATINRVLRNPDLPQYLQRVLPQLVDRLPMNRMSLEALKESEFFDNPLVRVVNFLDVFPAKLLSEKRVFLEGLHQILPQIPKSIQQRKVLQTLLDEAGKDEGATYLILKNVLTVGKEMSQLGFSERILPTIHRLNQDPGCQAAILDYLDILLSRLNAEEFKKYVLPVIVNVMLNAEPEKQRQALSRSGEICDKLDFVSLKNEFFPAVSELFSKTTSMSVKLESLRAFKVMIAHDLDKYTVTEKLLPLLYKMKTREASIIMAALEVYASLVTLVDIEVLATSVIPQILALSMETSLAVSQFEVLFNNIRSMLTRVEDDRRKRLVNNVAQDARHTPVPGANGSRQVSSSAPLSFDDLIAGKSNGGPSASMTQSGTPAAGQPDPFDSMFSAPTPSVPRHKPTPAAAKNLTSSLESLTFSQAAPSSGATLTPMTKSFGSTNTSGSVGNAQNRGFGSTGNATFGSGSTGSTTFGSTGGTSIDWSKATQSKEWSSTLQPTRASNSTSNGGFGSFQGAGRGTTTTNTPSASSGSSIPPLLPKPASNAWGSSNISMGQPQPSQSSQWSMPALNPQRNTGSTTQQQSQKDGLDSYPSLL